jgi:putative NADH-flavin reductase
MTKRKPDNSIAPFRAVTTTTLRMDKQRLVECLQDCVALVRGDISGPAQVAGILREADAMILAHGEKTRPDGEKA